MGWSATTRVGCGKREGVPMPWGGSGNVIMCNYNPGGNYNAPTYDYCSMGTKCSGCPSTHTAGCVDESGTSGSGSAFGLCSKGGVLASPPPPPADPEPQSGSGNCPLGHDDGSSSFCTQYKAYCSQYGDAMTVTWTDGKQYGLTQVCPDTCACEAAPPSWGGSSNCGECAAGAQYGESNPAPAKLHLLHGVAHPIVVSALPGHNTARAILRLSTMHQHTPLPSLWMPTQAASPTLAVTATAATIGSQLPRLSVLPSVRVSSVLQWCRRVARRRDGTTLAGLLESNQAWK